MYRSLSSSSSPSDSSPAPARRKRQAEAGSSDVSDDHDASDEGSTDDEHPDASQPFHSTEVTVLSHAERRRQKKKQKRQLATPATDSPRKKRKLDDGTPSNVDVKAKATTKTKTKTTIKAAAAADDPRRRKRQNSIWIGNLSFQTTQGALRRFFDGVGTITRVHMPMRREKQSQGENMGFAYVDFETPEAKAVAITLSEGQLDGRKLLIKDGDDFAGRPAKANTGLSREAGGGEGEDVVKCPPKIVKKILCAQKQPPGPTLFLGNLGFGTTEGSIRELFEAHRYRERKDGGKGVDVKADKQGNATKLEDVWIRKIRMCTFEDSGVCKGFAFVDFTSTEHATEVLVDPRNHRLDGRDLVIEYASSDAVRRGGGGPRHPKGDRDQERKSRSERGSANAPYIKQRQPRYFEQEDGGEVAETPAEAATTPCSRRPRTRRAKPGAALAHAQRQSAAILPSQGEKILF